MCGACGKTFTDDATSYYAEPEFLRDEQEVERLASRDVYLVTSAQNNTPLDRAAWGALLEYREWLDAELVVVPSRYRNPTSPAESKAEDDEVWWPAEVQPYLVDNLVPIHEHLWIMGHVRIRPTAFHPLSGLEPLSRGASAIFGHPQIAMQTVATPQHRLPKMLHTTGSVSRKNYSISKEGVKGDFHHSPGFLVVEKDGPRFHLRSCVGTERGVFYDLDRKITRRGVTTGHRAEGLVLGDAHAWFMDPGVRAATFEGPESLVGLTRPKRLVWHDVFDGFSCSPHHRRDHVARFAKHHASMNVVEQELRDTLALLVDCTPSGTESVVVPSNHHDFLRRWLLNADPKDEPWNALLYHELMHAVLKRAQVTGRGVEYPDPFGLWASARAPENLRFLEYDESLQIEGIEVSFHGHVGPGGARGSIRSMSKIGVRVVIGHRHVPGIDHGAYQVGTMGPLRPDYTAGSPTGTLHTHCLISPTGKRQLVSFIDARFRRT